MSEFCVSHVRESVWLVQPAKQHTTFQCRGLYLPSTPQGRFEDKTFNRQSIKGFLFLQKSLIFDRKASIVENFLTSNTFQYGDGHSKAASTGH